MTCLKFEKNISFFSSKEYDIINTKMYWLSVTKSVINGGTY